MKRAFNEFDPFLNECQTYVWEWYIPEQKVRFGIPSLNSLWIDDQEKNIQLATMLERVHPDDIQKVLVRHTSPLYKSDRMFEVDIRLNVAAELMPDRQSSGKYEWYGFRGKIVTRDAHGRPTYLRGIAINLDQRYRAQMKLISQKERQLQSARQQADYCTGVIQEVSTFIRNLAENADTILASDHVVDPETRLMRLSELKDQVSHILEVTDRFRYYIGGAEPSSRQEVQTLALWEHLAELQQVYSLKAGNRLKFYFSNLYDTLQIHVNVKLLDLLLDNVISAQLRLRQSGCATLSYAVDKATDTLRITTTFSGGDVSLHSVNASYSESGLGLSVCRLMAKRLLGDVQVEQPAPDRISYVIILPLDVCKAADGAAGGRDGERDDRDLLDELSQERNADDEAQLPSRSSLPHVLIGMSDDNSLYRNQHLFDVTITTDTETLLKTFGVISPDIVFLDSHLPGRLPVMDLIRQLHQLSPDTPIIVTDDYAQRPLHRQVQQLGARYLLNNPLSLRKVNMMIKKYLK